MKRIKPLVHGSSELDSSFICHVLIENTARAISDWQSEVDWPVHTDQAIRSIETISEFLQREGYVDASKYLRSVIHVEPKPRKKRSVQSKPV